jgi:hypothetical protein
LNHNVACLQSVRVTEYFASAIVASDTKLNFLNHKNQELIHLGDKLFEYLSDFNAVITKFLNNRSFFIPAHSSFPPTCHSSESGNPEIKPFEVKVQSKLLLKTYPRCSFCARK